MSPTNSSILSITDVLKATADIIKAAASSELGLIALVLLLIASLALLFFRRANTRVRLTVFGLIFLGGSLFIIAMAKERTAQLQSLHPVTESTTPNSSSNGVPKQLPLSIADWCDTIEGDYKCTTLPKDSPSDLTCIAEQAIHLSVSCRSGQRQLKLEETSTNSWFAVMPDRKTGTRCGYGDEALCEYVVHWTHVGDISCSALPSEYAVVMHSEVGQRDLTGCKARAQRSIKPDDRVTPTMIQNLSMGIDEMDRGERFAEARSVVVVDLTTDSPILNLHCNYGGTDPLEHVYKYEKVVAKGE